MSRHSLRNTTVSLLLSLGVAAAAYADLDRNERAIARHAAEGQASAEALLAPWEEVA